MRLDNLLREVSLGHKARRRVGRGTGSGRGKTCGRGHKGAGSRSGHRERLYYEGGQMPIFRRLPKRGFSNAPFKKRFTVVNVGELNRFEEGKEVTPEVMREARLVKGREPAIKVLGRGEVSISLKVSAHAFSESALRKIRDAGGKATVVE